MHDTVRVNVGISAQVDPTLPETDFRTEIQSTLRKFIDTDWKIQSIQRSKGTTRYESVYVAATARVSESENHQLQERATALSRIGFELVNPSVDYSLTFDEIQAVNTELRLSLFKQALIECATYNEALKDANVKVTYYGGKPTLVEYRISSSRFDLGDNFGASNATMPINMMMASSASMGAGSNAIYQDEETDALDADGGMDLNVSTRFAMTGTFVLRYLHG